VRLRDVAFDLDGTLVDSRPGIDRAAARAVAEVLPGREPVSLAPLIGPPIREMLAAAYADVGEDELDELVAAFRRAYDGGDWRLTTAFPGLDEVVRAFDRVFVVTNKPAEATQKILGHLGVRDALVEVVAAGGPTWPVGGKPHALADLARRYALAPESAAYVGDAPDDRIAAQHAGLPFVAVKYGYGAAGARPAPSDLSAIDHLTELLSL
jgi:phosphoglycolate phosphatase